MAWIRWPTFAPLLLAAAAPLAAQETPPPEAPRSELTLDASILGGSLGYARRTSERRLVGGGAGLGGDLVGYMLLGGRHFAEESGLSYESKDGRRDKLLFEVVHARAFVRHEAAGRWEFDTGVRASLFFHFDSTDDDPGAGSFLGGYAAAYYGFRTVKFGPRLLVGAFSEGRPEFGVLIAPVTVRLSLGW